MTYYQKITPIFKIRANNSDITATIAKHLISLTITDEAGISSDKLEITLTDSEAKIAIPQTGVILDVAIGYKETALTHMGQYIVDEISLKAPPREIKICARAADLVQSLKAPNSKSWGKVKIVQLVNDIATKHNLKPKISDELANFELPHLIQTAESDLHLLTRISNDLGAIAKPVNGFLLFVTKGQAKSVSGKLIAPIIIEESQVTSWRANFIEREKYKAVEGYWHNKDTGEKISLKIGDGEPIYKLRHTEDTKELLQQKLTATLAKLKRGTGTLSISLPGNTGLMAEGKLIVKGFKAGVDGVDEVWSVLRVVHEINKGGYISRVSSTQ